MRRLRFAGNVLSRTRLILDFITSVSRKYDLASTVSRTDHENRRKRPPFSTTMTRRIRLHLDRANTISFSRFSTRSRESPKPAAAFDDVPSNCAEKQPEYAAFDYIVFTIFDATANIAEIGRRFRRRRPSNRVVKWRVIIRRRATAIRRNEYIGVIKLING